MDYSIEHLQRRSVLYTLAGSTALIAGCSETAEDSVNSDEGEPSVTNDSSGDDGSSNDSSADDDDDYDDSDFEALDVERLVGAHYYPWYGGGGAYNTWTDETPSDPVLGEYDAKDPEVVDQHLEWCLKHGITWLVCSWWGHQRYEDDVIRQQLLRADRFQDVTFSILYETLGRLGGDHPFDADDDDVREQFTTDLKYLGETYFEEENYQTFDGRPVLYIYAAGTLTGDVASMYEDATDAAGVEPYIIVDVTNWDAVDSVAAFEIADAATIYNPSEDRKDIDEVFHDLYEEGLETLHLASKYGGLDFFTPVLPGYDDTEITHDDRDPSAVLTPTPDRYERACQQLQPHLDDTRGVLITSFNEWFEDTQIEPTEEFGTEYLELTADLLATGESKPFEPERTIVEFEWENTVQAFERSGAPSTDSRHIAFSCYELKLYDGDNEVVATYDIGSSEEEPMFIVGAHSPESHNGETARWFGGHTESTVFQTHIDKIAAIEIDGFAVNEMELKIDVGEQIGRQNLEADERQRYHVEL